MVPIAPASVQAPPMAHTATTPPHIPLNVPEAVLQPAESQAEVQASSAAMLIARQEVQMPLPQLSMPRPLRTVNLTS